MVINLQPAVPPCYAFWWRMHRKVFQSRFFCCRHNSHIGPGGIIWWAVQRGFTCWINGGLALWLTITHVTDCRPNHQHRLRTSEPCHSSALGCQKKCALVHRVVQCINASKCIPTTKLNQTMQCCTWVSSGWGHCTLGSWVPNCTLGTPGTLGTLGTPVAAAGRAWRGGYYVSGQ